MKQTLSLILTVLFVLSVFPFAVYAAGPKSLTSIEVTKAPSIYEGTGGQLLGGYDKVTGEYLGAYYHYFPDPDEVTLHFADGSSQVVTSDDECYAACGYYFNAGSDQSYENQWGIGYHTATLKIGSRTTTYTVTIIPMTIKYLEIEDVTLIEGLDGYEEYGYDSSTATFVTYFRYQYEYGLDARVVLGDDTTEPVYGGYSDHGIWGDLYITDGQSPANRWGVGPHKVTAYLLGKWCEFTVNVIENPVKSVEFHDITLMKWINSTSEPGFTYYQYYPDYTVTFKDGTTQNSERGYVYWNGKPLPVMNHDDQFTNPWTAENEMGDHYIDIAVGGVWGVQKVTVVNKYYSRMSMY